jgi:hypothetical protein
MWRLFSKLFGWQYVWVRDCGDSHICRVRKLPNGEWMGTIVSRNFFIPPSGKAYGAYLILDWKALTDGIDGHGPKAAQVLQLVKR